MTYNNMVLAGVYNNIFYKIEKNENQLYNCFVEIPEQESFKHLIKQEQFKKCFKGKTVTSSKQSFDPEKAQTTSCDFLLWQIPVGQSLAELNQLICDIIDQLFGEYINV